MSIKPVKPMGRSVNSRNWPRLILDAVVLCIMLGLIALVLVEWAVGCGETYTDAQGVEHQNECVVLPNRGAKP
jgi:hypothetical protein